MAWLAEYRSTMKGGSGSERGARHSTPVWRLVIPSTAPVRPSTVIRSVYGRVLVARVKVAWKRAVAIFDVGGTYLTMGYFDAGVALEMLEKYKVTALYPSFVTIMQGLVYHPSFHDTDLSRVKLMNSNFAVQPPGVAEPIMAAMPQALQVGSFGMTEAAGTVCTGGWDETEARRITRLGKPLPGLEVRIVNPETGHDLKNGMRGEVLVRGYSLFEGYYKDAEKSAQALDADGWFHTGDIGHFDDEGFLWVDGRAKEMIICGGENIAPAEIENVLLACPDVAEVAVVGRPDGDWGEVVVAVVAPKEGRRLTREGLLALLDGRIARYKHPRQLLLVDELPKTALGKVRREDVRRLVVEVAERGN